MTPSEIRTRQDAINKDMDARESVDGQSDIQRQEEMMLGVCFWLAEIAGQLAEQTDLLTKVYTSPKITIEDSPWVWFDTGDGTQIAVDIRGVRQVQNFKKYVVLNNPFERQSVTVYETLEQVCAKLGIPVEEP
jgi:hypothetical protein